MGIQIKSRQNEEHYLDISDTDYKKRVARNFGKAAKTYDSAARLQKRVAARARMLLPAGIMPDYVLDLGCGTGYETAFLNARYPDASIIGLDLSMGMIDFANSCHSQGHQWCAGDMENLPFASDSFDLIYSSLAIQWCDSERVLDEIHRVLKPGGSFVFSSLGAGTMEELHTAWQQVDRGEHTNRFSSYSEQKRVVEQSALQVNSFCRQAETLHYPSLKTLFRELKALGVNTVNSASKGLMTPGKLKTLETAYEHFRETLGLPLTYQVIYGQMQK